MNDPKKKEAGATSPNDDLEHRQEGSAPVAPEIVKKQSEIGNPMRVISEGTKAERLLRLRENHEVIEDDEDMIDIYGALQNGIPLTQKRFLKLFPRAKALMITQEQLWSMEMGYDRDEKTQGNRFSYITSSGKHLTVEGDYLDGGPLVLFLEDLGD